MAENRITEMFAFVTLDHEDNEGITGFMGPGKAWFPMVGADLARVAELERIAQNIANIHGREIRVIKFDGPPTVIKTIHPQGGFDVRQNAEEDQLGNDHNVRFRQ